MCLTLCDPMDCSLPGSSVLWIFQASILECIVIPFSQGSSQSRAGTRFSCIAVEFHHLSCQGSRKPHRVAPVVAVPRPSSEQVLLVPRCWPPNGHKRASPGLACLRLCEPGPQGPSYLSHPAVIVQWCLCLLCMLFLGWKRISAHPSVIANLCKILDQEFSFPSSRDRWILLLCMSLKSWTSGQALERRENFQSLVQKNAYASYPYPRGRKYTGKICALIPRMSTVITFYLQMHSQSPALRGAVLRVSGRPSFSFLCSSSLSCSGSLQLLHMSCWVSPLHWTS